MSGKFSLTGFQLKIIAIILMFIDHIGVYCPNMPFLRDIGRLSFPIFAFLISEGYHYTRNKKKYFSRLLIFALISEIPYNLFINQTIFSFSHQNIFFTLFFSFFTLFLYEKASIKKYKSLGVLGLLFVSLVAEILNFSYGAFGVLFIFSFHFPYFLEKEKWWKIIETHHKGIEKGKKFVLPTMLLIIFRQGTPYSLFSFLILGMYNGKRGKSLKCFFYFFYPLHLLFITFYFFLLS